MNHAQNHSLNFECLFKGPIRSAPPPKPVGELLQAVLAGGSTLSAPTQELLLWILARAAHELETRSLPSQAAQPAQRDGDPGGWVRAMEEFDRF